MSTRIREKHVQLAVIAAFALYAIFVQFTLDADFKPRPQYVDAWMYARYLVFAGWILLAYLVYKFRKESADIGNLRRAGISAGIVSFGLALVFGVSMFGAAILGSALTYTAISAFMCFTIKQRILNPVLAFILVPVQVIADTFVFWMAGNYQIH